jgi:hypothetical protein
MKRFLLFLAAILLAVPAYAQGTSVPYKEFLFRVPNGGGGGGGSTRWDAPDFSHVSCASDGGFANGTFTNCNSRYGTVFLNNWAIFGNVPGGMYDDDLSSFGVLPTLNSVNDFIQNGGEYPVNTGAAGPFTPFVTLNLTDVLTDADDTLLCRDNVTFQACSGGASCQSSLGGDQHPLLMIGWDASDNRYYPVTATAYSGCNSATNTLTVKTLRWDFDASTDKLYGWTSDGLHPSDYYYRLYAQYVLESTWEGYLIPRVDFIVNGQMDSDCTGWSDRGAGAVAPTHVNFDPSEARSAKNAIRGGGCMFVKGASPLEPQFDPVSVVPNRWYVITGWVQSAGSFTFSLRDGADRDNIAGLAATSTNWLADHNSGSVESYGGSALAVPPGNGCKEWCHVFIKVLIPSGITSVTVEFGGFTNDVGLDEWYAYEDPFQHQGVDYIFPNQGDLNVVVDGDSRADEFWNALDYEMSNGIVRDHPYLNFTSSWKTNSVSSAAARVKEDRAEANAGTLVFEKNPYSLVLGLWGVNDYAVVFGHGELLGPQELTNAYAAYLARIRESGAVPVILDEPRYWSDHSSPPETAVEGYICEKDGIVYATRTPATDTIRCADVVDQWHTLIITGDQLN